MPREAVADTHPLDEILRADRLPHIWCPGCGLGTVLGCFARAMLACGIPLDRQVVVSGIGCTGRAAGYLNVDGFHTTHGRAIPFATGLAIANPELVVTVFSGDGDLVAIGGNHLIHAARRNMDLNVICVNNFNYGMTGGQLGPTTPQGAITTTSPYGFPEEPFNLPRLLAACGAVFVARWTCLHVRQLEATMIRALQKRGFRFIEVLAPCPVGFGRPNELGEGIDEMWFYRRQADYDPQVALETLEIRMRKDSKIVCGVFVDTERPTYMDHYREYVLRKVEGGPGEA
ncbi:MAG: 2-oxoacid:ferredoxin oxidoreductase subunit beta [Armatimonadota bacterium]|nr:2-oxoacid:ferredoxin oxidoreductase subunit beta [Armatimonadota bacterium]MDR7440091.1 2-oxoacid:ferredoxin oxidoreductase subunit beta [Armatimonadota bacterium]MDR7563579.1 2-oxoacid:ferredoxin oxidoreductase subunit beta [Armatimonadota bacterium]MDR7568233.1 2-oxoacid:ferredoxin oxidoreductase subunit beta [Armatimonadota bacterium]MDR7602191.1 2-oxoacid:ferredoxin oxidoreductase subunit beta [Armatimonadota bacterium]